VRLDPASRAIADFDKLIVLDPSSAAAYCIRGDAYCHKGEFDCAIADYTKAIALNPKHATAYQYFTFIEGKPMRRRVTKRRPSRISARRFRSIRRCKMRKITSSALA